MTRARAATLAGLVSVVAGVGGFSGGLAQAKVAPQLTPTTTIAGTSGPAISGLPLPGGLTLSAGLLTPPPVGCVEQPTAQFLQFATTTTSSTSTTSTSTSTTTSSTTSTTTPSSTSSSSTSSTSSTSTTVRAQSMEFYVLPQAATTTSTSSTTTTVAGATTTTVAGATTTTAATTPTTAVASTTPTTACAGVAAASTPTTAPLLARATSIGGSIDATVDPDLLAATGARWIVLTIFGIALVVIGEMARRPILRARRRS